MAKKSTRKYMQEDIHRFMEEEDFASAANVLRNGMKATHVVRRNREDGERGIEYEEVPDHSTRLSAARMTLEYGFGKPATRHDITMTKETNHVVSPAEVMLRLKESGQDLANIIDVYAEAVQEVPMEIENSE